jgi:hypothetical protein
LLLFSLSCLFTLTSTTSKWSSQRFKFSKMQCCVTEQSQGNLVTAIHTLNLITATVKRCTWSISIFKICCLVFSYLTCLYIHLLRTQTDYCKDSNTTKKPHHTEVTAVSINIPTIKKMFQIIVLMLIRVTYNVIYQPDTEWSACGITLHWTKMNGN